MESGFGSLASNMEQKKKEEQAEKSKIAKERAQERKEATALKIKAEMEKAKALNQGAAKYMADQKAQQEKGKLNKGIQNFDINSQAGMAA